MHFANLLRICQKCAGNDALWTWHIFITTYLFHKLKRVNSTFLFRHPWGHQGYKCFQQNLWESRRLRRWAPSLLIKIRGDPWSRRPLERGLNDDRAGHLRDQFVQFAEIYQHKLKPHFFQLKLYVFAKEVDKWEANCNLVWECSPKHSCRSLAPQRCLLLQQEGLNYPFSPCTGMESDRMKSRWKFTTNQRNPPHIAMMLIVKQPWKKT